jgi:hypothetical protein
MSFDPFGQDPQPPAPQGPSDAPPTPGRERVLVPGILLILVAVLNLLAGGYSAVNAAVISKMPDEQFEKIMRQQQNEKQIQEMEKAGWTLPQLKHLCEQLFYGFGGVQLLSTLLALVGGIRMLQMKSYALCVLAAVVSAVPCVSASGCCCLGEVAGIWALVVLLGEEVRAGFR